MSFLAQLQQKQAPQTPSLSLYYLLDVVVTANAKLLQLKCVVGQSATGEDNKLYQVQAQHLKYPPPFLQPADIRLLTNLQSANAFGWPSELSSLQSFINELIATTRCYLKAGTQFIALNNFTQIAAALSWLRDTKGAQNLAPVIDTQRPLYTVGPLQCMSIDEQNGACQWCDIQVSGQPLTTEQQAAVDHYLQQYRELDAEALEHFYLANAENWQQLGLPLPTRDQATTLNAQCRISLVAKQYKGSSYLVKQAVYITPQYCTWFADHDSNEHPVFLAGQLCVIERNFEQEALFNKPLNKALKAFDCDATGYTSQTQSVWQSFFMQQKRQLEKDGIIFRIQRDFEEYYVAADDWVSLLKKAEKGHYQVDLFVQVGNERINLLNLLDQIQRLNQLQGNNTVRLKLDDGRWLLLPAEPLFNLREEFGDVLAHGKALQLHPSQRSRLQALDEILPSTSWQGDTQALEDCKKLHQDPSFFEQIDCGVKATLRPYQWLGVCWLQHLKLCGVNGLLADDMGLGKTLQTISHISLEFSRTQDLKPVLIVLPTSLLHNWKNEFTKFAPHLKVAIYHGPKRQQAVQGDDYQIMLTSYQLVVNDIDFFEQRDFSWLILDEAQAIKNHRTKAHSALKRVVADYKLCLSGTPVENNLLELWSLLNFLMPNVLGSMSEFKFHFQKAIEQEGNQRKLDILLKRIAPFMLRRTKLAVAKDLPEKTEIIQTIDLADEQAKLYEAIKSSTWQDLQQQLEGTGNAGEQQLFVLSALLKLRQVCCDPALIGEAETPSAKRQHCVAMAEELVAEGRAILIFSQFTSMLDLLAADLAKAHVPHKLLTGKTQNRQQLVDEFQAGEFSVFLISLKAGGVGLNLTRADTVIHYDPWWNSAAEQQATDRAHRIGQKNKVFVYKLIAENTIEEKIAKLQERKALLGDSINEQAQQTGAKFSLKLEELLNLWTD